MAAAFTGLLLAGCATYQAKSITEAAIQQATRSPDTAELRVRAEQIKHPILRPMSLDLEHGLRPDSAAVLAVLLNPSL
jgi:hypothetical protein